MISMTLAIEANLWLAAAAYALLPLAARRLAAEDTRLTAAATAPTAPRPMGAA
jgi:hypothetical protein